MDEFVDFVLSVSPDTSVVVGVSLLGESESGAG